MKKNGLILLFIIFFNFSFLFAGNTFGSADLNKDDEILFTLKQDTAGIDPFNALFYTKLKNGAPENSPQIITCYPEKMELLSNGTVLQIRNRYGIARYSSLSKKLNWVVRAEDVPINSLPVSYYEVSSNGKWFCCIEKESFNKGMLVLENTENGKKVLLCDDVEQSYEKIPVKWAPDSSVLVYEKNGNIYFCNPDALLRGVEIDEKYRKIGRGSINCVNWASAKHLVYIDDYLVYQINTKELYTLGLYSGIIGQGKTIGRLPFQFNSQTDTFSASPDLSSFVLIQNSKLFSFLKRQSNSFDYMEVLYSKPYSDSTASLVDAFIFWDKLGEPLIWLEKLPYDGTKETGSVFKLTDKTEPILEAKNSGKPFISPDGSKIAFFAGAAIYVYDINTWERIGKLEGENIVSALWVNRNVLYVGGESTIKKWNFVTDNSEVITLSSVEDGFWAASDSSVIYANANNGICYTYNRESCLWSRFSKKIEPDFNLQNGRYRIFTGITPNKLYENSLYVRTLSRTAVTSPVFKSSVEKRDRPVKVALVFDAYDNADGLPRILSTLRKYNTKGTFFLNGEFIRRYPQETKQIHLNNYSVASMFFSTTDLTENSFIIDEDFIRRGLARNEDEYFQTTNSELSLYWHAPFYKIDPDIIHFAQKAGYTYVNSLQNRNDSEFLDKDTSPIELIEEYCSTLARTNGGIVPVAVGFAQGNRTDPLYNYIDLLICALIDNGFELVSIEEL
ncbi:MAG: polysaccharide deacetylase family protein [Treponema sp.]|nr:polysaccharide deacetylase family protein [Treponema sp.]